MLILGILPGLTACTNSVSQADVEVLLESTLISFRQQHLVPGITTAIVLDDGRAAIAATGFADLEKRRPMSPETPMLAASIGKTFVAATILALAGEGMIELDARIASYLPDVDWLSRLPNGDTISIRHLLTHSSGLPEHLSEPAFGRAFSQRAGFDTVPFTAQELVSFVFGKQPLFRAGQGWSYTDTGYILLGLIVENVSGQSWIGQIENRFIVPLGLTLTMPSNHKDLTDLAAGYLAKENPFGLPEKTHGSDGRMVWNPAIEDAGGGFVSTSFDLARWGSALYRGQVLPAEMSRELFEAVRITPNDPTRLYGAGVSIVTGGEFGPVYGHGGHIPGYVSSLRYYPELGASIAFQINTDIGLVDGPENPIPALEQELARIVKGWLN